MLLPRTTLGCRPERSHAKIRSRRKWGGIFGVFDLKSRKCRKRATNCLRSNNGDGARRDLTVNKLFRFSTVIIQAYTTYRAVSDMGLFRADVEERLANRPLGMSYRAHA